MTDAIQENPKLRLIETHPVEYEGAQYLLLRDPLSLTEQNLLVPQAYIPALVLCDGSRNIAALRAALALRYGLFLPTQRLEEFVRALDDALLLDNQRSQQALAAARDQFRQAPFRPPTSAGRSYPENEKELAAYLQALLDAENAGAIALGAAVASDAAVAAGFSASNGHSVKGIISPHIDYQRGGAVYARVWGQAAQAVQQADLAIVFGTDHYSEGFPISLTRQSYATPYGVLPTAVPVVDQLAEVLGDAAFAGELHHRREHSIELAVVWLHHMRAGKPIELVPILTGSLDTMLAASNGHDHAGTVDEILEVLRQSTEGRKVIVIAAGDLAHIGPVFDGPPADPGRLIALQQADADLISAMCSGDAERFYGSIHAVQDENNVCGLAPIYLTLRLLAPTAGENLGYAVCPADEQHTSVVTICGVMLKDL